MNAIAFDAAFYLQQNPDVAAALATGQVASALDHFQAFGQREGRDPNEFFDTQFCLDSNPDVAAAVSSGVLSSAFSHFTLYGQFEGPGRAPNAQFISFDEADYLFANPDVAAAVASGTIGSGYEHFLLFGFAESRPGTSMPDAPALPSVTIIATDDVVAPGQTVGLSFDFASFPVGFDLDDVIITEGSGSFGFLMYPPRVGNPFTTFTPTPGFTGEVVLTIEDGSFTNGAGFPGRGDSIRFVVSNEEASTVNVAGVLVGDVDLV